jgi:hypothetical protein
MGVVSDKTIVCYSNVQYLLSRSTPHPSPLTPPLVPTTAFALFGPWLGELGAGIKLEMGWGVL